MNLKPRGMTAFALATLAESWDVEARGHLERVQNYCRILARRLQHDALFPQQVDDEYVRLIYETSPLHDLGKIAIPSGILVKPGNLTVSERETVNCHTVRGAEMLDTNRSAFPNPRFARMAYDVALSHHEKFDGNGYPRGLAGEHIPLCGRIAAVADVYDALTSKRAYKDAFSHAKAKSIIVGDSGKHFDPNIVDAFVAEERQFIEIRAQFCDGGTYAVGAAVSLTGR